MKKNNTEIIDLYLRPGLVILFVILSYFAYSEARSSFHGQWAYYYPLSGLFGVIAAILWSVASINLVKYYKTNFRWISIIILLIIFIAEVLLYLKILNP